MSRARLQFTVIACQDGVRDEAASNPVAVCPKRWHILQGGLSVDLHGKSRMATTAKRGRSVLMPFQIEGSRVWKRVRNTL